MESIWNKILAELEIEVSKGVFITMFKHTALTSLDNGVATIATPSPMVSNLIEKRYYRLLQKLLETKLEKNVSIVFVENPSLKKGGAGEKTALPLFNDSPSTDQKIKVKKAGLKIDFTFENFAVSSSNQLGFAAASAVAKTPGTVYNPLFFYGSVGVGKTHLMQAIGHAALSNLENKKVLYVTSEEFTNEFIESIRGKHMSEFRKKFRSVDVMLLDDVQFMAGKEKVQEELFHTFNSLVYEDKQIVFSSDKPPTQIDKIEKRLKSRFSGGLTVDISPPDMELRSAILLIKAKERGVELPMDLAKAIASEIEDTRRLEGAINRFIQELHHNGNGAKDNFIQKIIKDAGETINGKRVSSEDVLTAVCGFYGLKPTILRGPARDRSCVLPRHIAMYILKTELKKTLVEIGSLLGGRDHTTVMYGVSKIEKEIDASPKIRGDILGIKRSIWG